MDGQRQRSGFGRGGRDQGRRRKRAPEPKKGPAVEPIFIAARRPDSPLLVKAPSRSLAASAVPRKKRGSEAGAEDESPAPELARKPEPVRRAARIVQAVRGAGDDQERERQKLLGRLMQSDGRGAISRAADEFLGRGFELPDEQEVHLQLLEHFDESRARESLSALVRLLDEAPPVKRPVLDQRLRRLEEHADEAPTRELAAELRRSLRV